MRKLVALEWMTLDGVFDGDSMADWFFPYNTDSRQAVISECIMAADALLLGRNTFEMLAPYWSSLQNNEMGIADRLNSIPKYVVASQPLQATWNPSVVLNGDLTKQITRLKDQPGQNILIFGSGTLVRALMALNLIDDYRVLLHPYTMGYGQRLFDAGTATTKLHLVQTKPLDLGVVLLDYQSAAV